MLHCINFTVKFVLCRLVFLEVQQLVITGHFLSYENEMNGDIKGVFTATDPIEYENFMRSPIIALK